MLCLHLHAESFSISSNTHTLNPLFNLFYVLPRQTPLLQYLYYVNGIPDSSNGVARSKLSLSLNCSFAYDRSRSPQRRIVYQNNVLILSVFLIFCPKLGSRASLSVNAFGKYSNSLSFNVMFQKLCDEREFPKTTFKKAAATCLRS